MRRFHIPPQPQSAIKCTLLTVATGLVLLAPGTAARQAKDYPLESTDGLRLHNVAAQPATLQGKKGLRVTMSEEAQRRLQAMTPRNRRDSPSLPLSTASNSPTASSRRRLPARRQPGAGEGARGFVGIAFRLQNDRTTYDAFYLRPTNGRADDQERRNHAVQYISHPTGHGSGCARRPRPGTNRT